MNPKSSIGAPLCVGPQQGWLAALRSAAATAFLGLGIVLAAPGETQAAPQGYDCPITGFHVIENVAIDPVTGAEYDATTGELIRIPEGVAAASVPRRIRPPLGAPGFCFKLWGGQEWIDVPARGWLATERLATGLLVLDAVRTGGWLDGHTGGAQLGFTWGQRIVAQGLLAFYVMAGLDGTWINHSRRLGDFETEPGEGLGIPGPGGGPTGAFFPFPLLLSDLVWRTEIRWASPYLNLGTTIHTGRFGQHQVYVGGRHSYLDQSESFTAHIPLFESIARYDTDFDSRAWGGHVGWKGRAAVGRAFLLGRMALQTYLSGRAELGVADVRATVGDRLQWAGFLANLVEDSRHRATASRTSVYWQTGASVSFENPRTGSQVFFDASYGQRPWFPHARRDGTNPTRVVIEDADVWSILFGLRLMFGGAPLPPT